MLSPIDGCTPMLRIRPDAQIILSTATPGEQPVPVVSLPSVGCFGQSVLVGCRRTATCVAHSACELLTIEKGDLIALFQSEPLSASRLCESTHGATHKALVAHSPCHPSISSSRPPLRVSHDARDARDTPGMTQHLPARLP